MNTIHTLIRSKTFAWIQSEKENNRSVITEIINYIEKKDKLRPPQKEAIETYLWIKFIGKNRSLSDIIKSGLLTDKNAAQNYDYHQLFSNNHTTIFLNLFFQDNNLKKLHKKLLNDPNGKNIDWDSFLRRLLHDFSYPNYLFSLPMGAGKTYLMASFIYLDLYFASLFKTDGRFAHNFVVFAPGASKTAIMPSLKTIKDFNPQWLFPKKDADKLKQIISIEILDSLSSKRKDKLHGNNPNLEKVNRLMQTKDFGLVFITNAEKVILEKYNSQDEIYYADKNGLYYDAKKAADLKKINRLREAMGKISSLCVILDEVHHTYGKTGKGEKKLRKAVNILNKSGNVNSAIGLSGTPYVKTYVEIDKEKIRLNQIQDIVYNYPLNYGIGRFLKIPIIKGANVTEEAFINEALDDFFNRYDATYKNGTKSKIAFYCPTVRKLNENILPVIRNWYDKNRKGKEREIFRYYSAVDKKNAEYRLPKENLAIFNNLDKPYSDKRVILLVAVGKEGWDCKSLTAVALPRQKTKKNFVLQTTCRCLREVDNASSEKALIYLSGDNYSTLDKELKDNYRLSISDIRSAEENRVKAIVRKPKLGIVKYNQIEIKYKIISRTAPEIKEKLSDFSISSIKNRFEYNNRLMSGKIGKAGITNKQYTKEIKGGLPLQYRYSDLIYGVARETYGLISENILASEYKTEFCTIYNQIEKEINWIELNPLINIEDITKEIAACFTHYVKYSKEIIKTETKIELLEWESENRYITVFAPDGTVYKFMPQISRMDAKMYRRHPEDIIEDCFSENENIDPQNISFNYLPYRMDSAFEIEAFTQMLQMAELKNLELYYNGYKNGKLQSFYIQTPAGKYTPDFLILKREEWKKYIKDKNIPIEKMLIIETKAETYYTDQFRAKERFIKEEFLKENQHISYQSFIDDGTNNFQRHLTQLKEILKNF